MPNVILTVINLFQENYLLKNYIKYLNSVVKSTTQLFNFRQERVKLECYSSGYFQTSLVF